MRYRSMSSQVRPCTRRGRIRASADRRMRRAAIAVALSVGAVCGLAVSAGLQAAPALSEPDSTAVLEHVQQSVAAICDSLSGLLGYRLTRPVPVARQSLADFQEYIDQQLDQQYSADRRQGFVLIMEMLGLLPPGTRLEDLISGLYGSQAAAYFDPVTDTFYLLMEDMDSSILDMLSAHELTHAFQDQRYDLAAFLFDPVSEGRISGDAALARQFLVEGQATWTMSIYYARSLGLAMPLSLFGPAFEMQTKMPYDQLLEQFKAGANMMGEDLADAAAAAAELPRVLMAPLMLSYYGGAAFMHRAFMENGLAGIDSLFADPPRSSEQVLHPERFFDERDEPRRFGHVEQKPLDSLRFLSDSPVLIHDTLGELIVRVYFQEHGMTEQADALASGWDGDVIVALQDEDERPAVLWWTVWDSPEEAEEFADGFRQSLSIRFAGLADRGEALSVQDDGRAWFIERQGDTVRIAAGLTSERWEQVRRQMAAVVCDNGG